MYLKRLLAQVGFNSKHGAWFGCNDSLVCGVASDPGCGNGDAKRCVSDHSLPAIWSGFSDCNTCCNWDFTGELDDYSALDPLGFKVAGS